MEGSSTKMKSISLENDNTTRNGKAFSFVSVSTSFLMALGLIKYWQVFDEKLLIYQIYHTSFSLLVLIVVMNLFVSLINETYDRVRTKKLYEYDAELMEYTWQKLQGIVNNLRAFVSKGKCLKFNYSSWL